MSLTEDCSDTCMQLFNCFFVIMESSPSITPLSILNNNQLSKQEEEEQRLNSLMYGMTTKNPTPILSICGRGFASPTDLKIHLEQNPNSAQVLSVVDRNLPIHVICIKGIPLITSQNIRSYTILFILRTIKH